MSLAKIVATLVERGEEDLAEELLAVAAHDPQVHIKKEHRFYKGLLSTQVKRLSEQMKAGDVSEATASLGALVNTAAMVAVGLGKRDMESKLRTLGNSLLTSAGK
jgi:hypothetical protein